MNSRGVIPIIAVALVSASILIAGFLIAYKPQINCSISEKPHTEHPSNVVALAPTK